MQWHAVRWQVACSQAASQSVSQSIGVLPKPQMQTALEQLPVCVRACVHACTSVRQIANKKYNTEVTTPRMLH